MSESSSQGLSPAETGEISTTLEASPMPEQLRALYEQEEVKSKAGLSQSALEELARAEGLGDSSELTPGITQFAVDQGTIRTFVDTFSADAELRDSAIQYAKQHPRHPGTFVEGLGYAGALLAEEQSKQDITDKINTTGGMHLPGEDSHGPAMVDHGQIAGEKRVDDPNFENTDSAKIQEDASEVKVGQLSKKDRAIVLGRHRAQLGRVLPKRESAPLAPSPTRTYEEYMDTLRVPAKEDDWKFGAMNPDNSAAGSSDGSRTPAISSVDIQPANDAPKLTDDEYTAKLSQGKIDMSTDNKSETPVPDKKPERTYVEYMNDLFRPKEIPARTYEDYMDEIIRGNGEIPLPARSVEGTRSVWSPPNFEQPTQLISPFGTEPVTNRETSKKLAKILGALGIAAVVTAATPGNASAPEGKPIEGYSTAPSEEVLATPMDNEAILKEIAAIQPHEFVDGESFSELMFKDHGGAENEDFIMLHKNQDMACALAYMNESLIMQNFPTETKTSIEEVLRQAYENDEQAIQTLKTWNDTVKAGQEGVVPTLEQIKKYAAPIKEKLTDVGSLYSVQSNEQIKTEPEARPDLIPLTDSGSDNNLTLDTNGSMPPLSDMQGDAAKAAVAGAAAGLSMASKNKSIGEHLGGLVNRFKLRG